MNSHARLRNVLSVFAILLAFPALGLWAQAGGAAAPVKIGVINIRQAIIATKEGTQASSQLNVQFTPRQNDLESLNKQIQDLQGRLNSGARTLSDDEKTRLQRQGELLSHEFQRKQDDLNEELTAAQSEIVDTIGRKMFDIIDHYSKDNGLAVVLDTSAQGSPVVYGAGSLDITQDIVGLYDKAYAVKGGETESKAAPKPSGAPAASAAPKKATPPSQ
jgi:outer membrane protein